MRIIQLLPSIVRGCRYLRGKLLAALLILFPLALPAAGEELDPAAWGADHVGKSHPEYVTGDECLFCHRQIGPTWGANRHQQTIRPAAPDDPAVKLLRKLPEGHQPAADTQFLLGAERAVRYLKRSPEYGKLQLLSASFMPRQEALQRAEKPHWQDRTFADRCAGCHATAVDAPTRSFSAISLDCYVCHGNVPLEHSKDPRRVLLSEAHREPRQVISLCGQCHLRGGQSQSTGLPYPNTFVAGDNLFRDFRVELSEKAIRRLHPTDRHIFENTRDVVLSGGQDLTCLTCHDVHEQSTLKHQRLQETSLCSTCHEPGTDRAALRSAMRPAGRLSASSHTCDYGISGEAP